jgi:hypothetical protein
LRFIFSAGSFFDIGVPSRGISKLYPIRRLSLTSIKRSRGAYPSPDDSTLLAWRASVPLFMVYVRRSALSRALYAGTQVLFCAPTTLSS